MHIAVVGLSHKTASVDIREKLSISELQMEEATTHLCRYPNIEEVAILSTCNRMEIYAVLGEANAGIQEITQFLAERSNLPLGLLRSHLFMLLHEDAVMHLMRVGGGLDSLVLGEGQILAQVKQTHSSGQKCKGIGRILNRLFKQAITAGKRVRTETSIGTGAVSISSAAVELAQTKVNNLADYRILILGAGKMSRLLVQHLISKGATHITVLNRTIKRVQDLAKQFPDSNIKVGLLDDMLETIAESDMVFTSTSASKPILTQANLAPVVSADHPLMVIDIAVPRNVAGDVHDMAHVQAFNVDDLKAVVARNQESRRRMMIEAEGLLEEEVESFQVWLRSLDTVSTISSLREKVETIRSQELEKALSRLGSEFAEKHQEVIEALTRGIVNKILHDPMVQLRAQQDAEARRQAMHTLETLFNLQTASREAV